MATEVCRNENEENSDISTEKTNACIFNLDFAYIEELPETVEKEKTEKNADKESEKNPVINEEVVKLVKEKNNADEKILDDENEKEILERKFYSFMKKYIPILPMMDFDTFNFRFRDTVKYVIAR